MSKTDIAPPRWGLGDAAGAFVLSTALAILLLGLAGTGSTTPTFTDLALGNAGSWGGLVGWCMWAARTKGSGSLATDFGFRIRPLDPALGALAGFGSSILVTLLYVPFDVTNDDLETDLLELTDRLSGIQLVAIALLIAVGAPLVEELFFRGLLLRSLLRRMHAAAAIGVSAVIFGIAHFQVLQFPALVMFGVVLAVLTVRTGRLGPAIAAHVMFNGLTVVALVLS